MARLGQVYTSLSSNGAGCTNVSIRLYQTGSQKRVTSVWGILLVKPDLKDEISNLDQFCAIIMNRTLGLDHVMKTEDAHAFNTRRPLQLVSLSIHILLHLHSVTKIQCTDTIRTLQLPTNALPRPIRAPIVNLITTAVEYDRFR